MKTILAVSFFGIVTFAFADYTKIQNCEQPEAMQNFDANKFLKGTWYVTNAKQGSESTVCREYKAGNENGELNGDGYYNFKGQKTYFQVSCKKTSENKGKMTFQCTQRGTVSGNEMNFQFQLEVTIVSTDYNSYAVMYRCVKLPTELGGGYEDNVLILRRDAKQTEVESIKATVKNQEWTLDKFISRKDDTCSKLSQK
uniref:Lipocalin/cytosolic fatty-acid binding domain-containing protein n=1 Tax=Triatoma rubida TaxID=162364 RepID=G8JKD7_9HEMI